MDEDEKEGREIARAMVETINAKVWAWAEDHAESLMNCKGERKLKYVNLGRLKEYLGV